LIFFWIFWIVTVIVLFTAPGHIYFNLFYFIMCASLKKDFNFWQNEQKFLLKWNNIKIWFEWSYMQHTICNSCIGERYLFLKTIRSN
jgi:hypothetical protein